MLLLFCSVLLEFLSWTLSACPGHLALGFLPLLLSDMNHAQFATVPHTGDAIKKMRVLVRRAKLEKMNVTEIQTLKKRITHPRTGRHLQGPGEDASL